jgi:undecaprenyl-diphosphatase
MSWWQGAVLGLVQGLTEFLPISSSGHLVVAEVVIGLETPGVMVEVVLHVATLLAVVAAYYERLWQLLRDAVSGRGGAWRYVLLLGVGTVPAAVVGLLFAEWFERAFDSLFVVGLDFVATAGILWSTRWIAERKVVDEPSVAGAAGIGIAQALAVMPGISRSGSTIAAGMWLGVDPVRAAEYSFLLAIPAIAGAAVLQIPDLRGEAAAVGIGPLGVGFLAALVSGIAAIRVLVVLLRKGTFHRFAPYCMMLGVVTIVWALFG